MNLREGPEKAEALNGGRGCNRMGIFGANRHDVGSLFETSRIVL